MTKFKILIFLLLNVSIIAIVEANLCISKTNCKECIQSIHSCGWCLQNVNHPNFANVSLANDDFNRCDYIENLVKYCHKDYIFYPQNEHKILLNEQFKPLDSNGQAIQIRPQKVNLKLRPHSSFRFNISYQLAEDYPVDLYFLMDLSNSMDVHKNKLSKLGQLLASSMRNITKNFRLGFGSFVEKETLPFVNTAPRSMSNPCMSTDKSGQSQCVPPYGYIHHMTLTDNTTQFEEEVTAAKVSGNLDSPEGGLDALMQAIVCEREIGWRSASRKLIVYSTDAGFHYAGDGKLAGIIEPNDGKCHLNSQRRYTHGLIQDYPSIGEINYKITQNNVNLIFAVVRDQAALYKNLSELIEGSFVGELDDDSSNIVKLVVDIYKTIAKKITFTTESLPEGVEIKFYSKCQNETSLQETNSCDEIKIKEKVEFQVEVTLTKCPERLPNGQFKPIQFNISAQGIGERVSVTIDSICECDCEKDNNQQNSGETSSYCNARGRIVCGVCECDPLYYGNKCECSKLDSATESSSSSASSSGTNNKSTGNISSCINPRQNTIDGQKIICNNQGRCNCGQCVCNDPSRISGKYCECDNESCDRYLGVVCAGNGRCECGICKCNDGWTKSDCSCSTNNSSCISANGLICNGKGSCVCGKCVCHEDSGYFGRTCEDCPTCPLPCENNRDCVQCKVFGTGKKANKKECDETCDIELQEVERINTVDPNYKICQFNDMTDNCTFFFSYERFNDKRIRYVREKDCPSTFPTWAIILIIVSGVLFIGFAILIIWKILDTMQQKRECARFNEEKKRAAWETSENPLYKSATSRFENPLYNKTK